MKTKRPRLAVNLTGYHIDERVSVHRCEGNSPVLCIGDRVLVRFVSRVRFRDGTLGEQVVRVTVTNVRGDLYRGEVDCNWPIDRKLFRPDELRAGQVLTFVGDHVFIVYR